MVIRDVIVDPNATSTNFLVHGHEQDSEGAAVFAVDFGMMFPRRCQDVDLAGNSHGARPVHLLITMIKWIRTSRLSIKNSLSDPN